MMLPECQKELLLDLKQAKAPAPEWIVCSVSPVRTTPLAPGELIALILY